VGRTQTVLYCLYQLKKQNAIPNIPVFVDSPMATNVTQLFCMFQDEHTLSSQLCADIFDGVTYVRTTQESEHLRHLKEPAIIIAGSGMADGGRMIDHMKRFISSPKNTIVFVGFQAEGTYGRALIEGLEEIKIYNKMYPVRAQIKALGALSAHADYKEILQWLEHFENLPKKTFITHGEKEAALALQEKIEQRFGWSVVVPKYLQSFDLDLM
jgi:metallo-beta-lactamase family protein